MPSIALREKVIPFPAIPLGATSEGLPVVVRVGRFGSFVQRGEGGAGHRSSVPDEIAPADLTLRLALDPIERQAAGPAAIGTDPATGRGVFFLKGRFGPYLEIELSDQDREAGNPPRRLNVPADFDPTRIPAEDLAALLRLPREVGVHPESGVAIVVKSGKFGPYLECAGARRNLQGLVHAAGIGLDEALSVLASPPSRRGATASKAAPKAPLRDFGPIEGVDGSVRILDGRYGPYVSDGSSHATLPKGSDPMEVSLEDALALLRERAASGKKKRTLRAGRGTRATSSGRASTRTSRRRSA